MVCVQLHCSRFPLRKDEKRNFAPLITDEPMKQQAFGIDEGFIYLFIAMV